MGELGFLHFDKCLQNAELVIRETHCSSNPIIHNIIQFFIIESTHSGFCILKGMPGFSALAVLNNKFPDCTFPGPRRANTIDDAKFLQFMSRIDLAIAHDFFCFMNSNSTSQQAHPAGAREEAKKNFRETEFSLFFSDDIVR